MEFYDTVQHSVEFNRGLCNGTVEFYTDSSTMMKYSNQNSTTFISLRKL